MGTADTNPAHLRPGETGNCMLIDNYVPAMCCESCDFVPLAGEHRSLRAASQQEVCEHLMWHSCTLTADTELQSAPRKRGSVVGGTVCLVHASARTRRPRGTARAQRDREELSTVLYTAGLGWCRVEPVLCGLLGSRPSGHASPHMCTAGYEQQHQTLQAFRQPKSINLT